MGKVITFPLIRRKPHVCLVWDWAWDQYRVEAVGILVPAALVEWHEDYGQAFDALLAMSERVGLPPIDCTAGRVA